MITLSHKRIREVFTEHNVEVPSWYARMALIESFWRNDARRWSIDRRINYRASIDAAVARGDMGNGKMRVEECGRDCDGMEYWGRLHMIWATRSAYLALQDQIGEWADGPFSLYIIPRDEPDPDSGSHDTFAEAAGY